MWESSLNIIKCGTQVRDYNNINNLFMQSGSGSRKARVLSSDRSSGLWEVSRNKA